MLRGPGLTPHRIRAERSSNLSFQKLRGAGLTPHFHDERSSNASLRARISSLCSPPSIPRYRGRQYFYYGQLRTLAMLRPQVRQPGPAVWTHGGVEVVLLFANAYLFISLVHNGLVHD